MKTYDAVPTPKLVIAAGACAISGGIYSGFANRWNFLYGEPKGPMPNPPQVSDNDERELLKDINQVRKWALSLPHEGVIGKSKEAEEMLEKLYIDFM